MTPVPPPSEYPPPKVTDPHPPDYPPPLDADCLAGKHHACLGYAWDFDIDEEVDCQCGCHEIPPRPAIQNVVESL